MTENAFFNPHPKMAPQELKRHLFSQIGKEKVLDDLQKMLLIRHFDIRGESAYQQGLVGGFYHSSMGQEAIAVAALRAFGSNNWFSATYRCHALALLLGPTPNEIMAELYGKETGIAKGRGGSMHLFADRLLGGFAIVGGHLPVAAGAAFSNKYLKKKDELSICFLGDGAVAQGAFHEALNLASLWSLPVIYIIENNQWGMGTNVKRAISFERIAEKQANAYGLSGYTLNGMDYFNSYAGFEHIEKEVKATGKPVLVECLCERFRGHSISDPALYRSKEELQKSMEKDPILMLRSFLQEEGILSEKAFKEMDAAQKERVVAAMKFAEESPFPALTTLEEDVYAP